MKQIKVSKYNYIFKSTKYGYLIYNGLTNAFAKINNSLYQLLQDVKINSDELTKLDKEIYESLVTAKILTDSVTEEDQFYMKRSVYYSNAFNSSQLQLTIAPTSACNFACTYCFENGVKAKTMSNKTITDLVSFIKSYKHIGGVQIMWYGGEPLLAISNIKLILSELKHADVNILSQGMITNGYLLDDATQKLLIDIGISFLQITLDGDEQNHNMRRPLKRGNNPTYSNILKNIDGFLAKQHNVNMSIRCNVDRGNVSSFVEIKDELERRWNNDERVAVYPGIITGESNNCSNGCVLMDNNDVANLFLDVAKNTNKSHYFNFDSVTCGAGAVNSFVVGPEGELYKCWNEIGKKDRIIGFLDNENNPNPELLARYLAGPSVFDDEKCKDCPLLFVCNGGCLWKRLENKYNGTNYELCSYQKNRIDDFLELRYEQKIIHGS